MNFKPGVAALRLCNPVLSFVWGGQVEEPRRVSETSRLQSSTSQVRNETDFGSGENWVVQDRAECCSESRT